MLGATLEMLYEAPRPPKRADMKQSLRTCLGRTLTLVTSALLALIFICRWIRGRGKGIEPPQSVLLVRLDLMGDIVNGLSAAHAARHQWPNAHIAYLAPPPWREIVDCCSAVDETIALDPAAVTHWPACLDPRRWVALFRALRGLRRRRFDIAVSIYGPIAGTFVALSGATERRGYRQESPPFSFDISLPGNRCNGGLHETELATQLIGSTAPSWRTVDRSESFKLPAVLEHVKRPLVIVHTGSSHGDAKRWEHDHWAHTLAEICEAGATVALVGLPAADTEDPSLTSSIAGLIDLTNQTTLEMLIGTLATADLVISTDSGPAHLARATGTRVIALHGPTDVNLHGPGDPSSISLRVDVPCGPCYDFRTVATCTYDDTLCMKWLDPARVIAAARTALAKAGYEHASNL